MKTKKEIKKQLENISLAYKNDDVSYLYMKGYVNALIGWLVENE